MSNKKICVIGSVVLYLFALFLLGLYVYYELEKSFFISILGRGILLGGSSLFIYFGGILLSKTVNEKNKERILKFNLFIILIMYFIILFTLTLFDSLWGRRGLVLVKWTSDSLNSYISNSFNIIPFKTIYAYISKLAMHKINMNVFLTNIFGNLMALTPLSLLFPILFKNLKNIKNFTISIIGVVFVIEILQFLTLSGSCDIDDIILNTLGALLMFKILNIISIRDFVERVFLLRNVKINYKDLVKKISIMFIIVLFLLILIKIYGQYNDRKYNPGLDISIINTSDCNDEIPELIYEDSSYKYYLPCAESGKIYIKINDKKFSLKELLNNEELLNTYHLSISKLKSFGIEIYQSKK